jgi:hypothetical protein
LPAKNNVGKENILGLISIRQIDRDSKGEIFVQEKSSHVAGTYIVSAEYPLFNSLSSIRKQMARKFKLVRLLNEIDDQNRYEIGLKQALSEAKRHDEERGITFIENWKKSAVTPDIKIRL